MERMIELTRLNGSIFVLNADLVETVETTPDTVILLSNGHRYVVRESMEEVTKRILAFRRRVIDHREFSSS
jgi:flagellar protein FlbD